MKDTAFQELLTSVRQAGQIRRGTRRASRTTAFHPTDVQVVRAKLGASQAEFALMIGVSVATLRNWEQGRRTPDGPARCQRSLESAEIWTASTAWAVAITAVKLARSPCQGRKPEGRAKRGALTRVSTSHHGFHGDRGTTTTSCGR